MQPITVALLSLVAVAPLAGSAPAPVAHGFDVTAHDDGADYWFEVAGLPGRNPDLHVEPGETVAIHLHNLGMVQHNFVAAALGGVPCCVLPGGWGNGTFILPTQDTNVAYRCELHQDKGMAGRIVVGAGAGRDTPVPAWTLIAGLAVALTVRKAFGANPRRRMR